MESNQTSAFLMSTVLHSIGIGLVLFFTYGLKEKAQESPTIFELVAGEGDNYMAEEAPALGTPEGITISIPEPAAASPEPVHVTPAPVIERAPVAAAPAKAPEEIPDMAAMLKRKAAITQIRKEANDKLAQRNAERRARAEAARQAKAEAERAKKEAAANRKMTKADFDRLNKTKDRSPKTGSSVPKVARIDAKGIATGVLGGSTANTTGGAGGKALTRAEGDAVDGYTALLGRKIKESLDEKPGVGAGLVVEVEIRIMANGDIRGFRIMRSSGSRDFDDAVREAFATLRMPPRPTGLSELQRFPIRGVEE